MRAHQDAVIGLKSRYSKTIDYLRPNACTRAMARLATLRGSVGEDLLRYSEISLAFAWLHMVPAIIWLSPVSLLIASVLPER